MSNTSVFSTLSDWPAPGFDLHPLKLDRPECLRAAFIADCRAPTFRIVEALDEIQPGTAAPAARPSSDLARRTHAADPRKVP
jgi:hypothetical protein